MIHLPTGKVSLVIDGQFGSTGKGLMSAYIAEHNHIDIAASNAGPNSGHTFYFSGKKRIVHHLPVSAVVNDACIVFLCAGSIINPTILMKELADNDISLERLVIHPRAAVISDEDIVSESDLNSKMQAISSTQNGVGSALKRKVERTAQLAEHHPILRDFTLYLNIQNLLNNGKVCLMEVPQGLGLGINSGLSYPYCTSRDITVSSALSDLMVHPHYLGNVIACMRTFPIRVGNLAKGESGPFYYDSKETTWDELGIPREYTTCTNRVRRVATFSFVQYNYMISTLRPDYVFLNFANYMNDGELKELLSKLEGVTHLGFGKETHNVYEL